MTFLRKHSLLLKILALLIAFVLWAIVVTTDDLERTIEFNNVKVDLIGNSSLLSEKDLMVLDPDGYTVSVKLRGRFNRLRKISAEDITVRADVSGITESGNVLVSYDTSVPNGISTESSYPEKLTLRVDEMTLRELPVRVEYEGEIGEDYQINEAIVYPVYVDIRALSSELIDATYALVTLNAEELTSDFSAEMNYCVTDIDGTPIEFTKINYIDPTIKIKVPVFKKKVVPFSVSTTGTMGVNSSNVTTLCEPSSVTVIGKSEVVDGVKSIELGKVNASDYLLDGEAEFKVVLPEGVDFFEDEIETVKVQITLKNTIVNQFTITDISLENLPEERTASVETQNLVLVVRGPKDTILKLTPEDFTVKIDFSNMPIVQNGRQVMSVSVTSKKDGFDIIGTYTVIVNIAEK